MTQKKEILKCGKKFVSKLAFAQCVNWWFKKQKPLFRSRNNPLKETTLNAFEH